jgi:hypothetical protein
MKSEDWKELDKDATCHRFSSNCTASTLPRKLLKALQTSNKRTSNKHCEICK